MNTATIELLDLFDNENRPLNIQKPRDEVHANGYWHRTAHIWMYTPDQILLQLRSKEKSGYPNKWDIAVGGHILAGTDPYEGAAREMFEEVGLIVEPSDLQFMHILKGDYGMNKEFVYVYLYKFTQDISQLVLQKEEVDRMQLIAPATLRDELRSKPDHYVPHGDYWFDMIQIIETQQKA